MSFLRGLFRSSKQISKVLVGSDKMGNKYYEKPGHTNSKGRDIKLKRSVEAVVSHHEYEAGMIPLEWEAWVRGRRELPPTEEEIDRRENQTQIVKARAAEVELKDKERQEREYEEGLVARPVQVTAKGHASAPIYEKIDSGSEAVSTGKDFEPAAWKPSKT
ncbi:NADH dehydrogenase [ubiquinone] 1 alpha subcomplex assembly factor 2 [Strongylocentrotus purpuratus]|uniref:NADH dehydrogenase [ubiquinone] 1 alpha subcomplex assembly factor 2 n=1 Tax=Strongylocentrotus purpuratus TaxID=7668 RepID=A0A7M7PK33_STRPU|nr:NADH dehydrogenase [ubiquinone] 1 alpha subcomplex assembly factor 2 [Strongylocentrotus purpuratus]|eukprot:XP_797557.3 PREDICTED: mimitin, mitochondrial [Strongylocentrotus purpuratus]